MVAVSLKKALQAASVRGMWPVLGVTPLFVGLSLVLLAAAVLVIAAALVRIREINGGEEDDLSQY